jgi:hypothetical protein
LRRQPFPEARQASAINEAMSSSGRRLKPFANSTGTRAPITAIRAIANAVRRHDDAAERGRRDR